MEEHLFDEQTLRLLKAYFKVRDPKVRQLIIRLAESAADGATVTAQVTDDQSRAKLN